VTFGEQVPHLTFHCERATLQLRLREHVARWRQAYRGNIRRSIKVLAFSPGWLVP
jgi:hypothetical protein